MEKDELLRKMRKVRSNLEYARSNLRNARSILDHSITFNNDYFKNDNISNLNSRLNKQITNLNIKIIPGLNKM